MFTPPQISTNHDLKSRSFIYFYFENKRYKFYNGNKLELTIHPNHAKTIKQRQTLLEKLKFEYHKALTNGWKPTEVKEEKDTYSVKYCFDLILKEKLESPYSKTYKRDLSKLHEQFIASIPNCKLEDDISSLDTNLIEVFLNQFKSSGRHYMNKRRSLSVFYSEFVRRDYLSKNPILKTVKQKVKAKLHDIYTEQQLKNVLEFLKTDCYNLYLCALLTYGCLLRPHQEIRQLTKKHISEDYSKINLSGDENKSGRIRTVFIPKYLQQELKEHLNQIVNLETNIFTLSNQSFNDDYFKTQWSRAKIQMLKKNIIEENQTLYSFRHTAVVNIYRKTKDLHVLQQMLQHSNMIVTLNYLRGLGETTNSDLKNYLPEL